MIQFWGGGEGRVLQALPPSNWINLIGEALEITRQMGKNKVKTCCREQRLTCVTQGFLNLGQPKRKSEGRVTITPSPITQIRILTYIMAVLGVPSHEEIDLLHK